MKKDMTTTTSTALFEHGFRRVPAMAILRGFDTERTLELTGRAWDEGIELVEIPIQSSAAIDALRRAAARGTAAGHVVGAGTVTTLDRVAQARAAGAGFTVAPGFDPVVAAASLAAGMPHLPGVATASEVGRALGMGLTWLKMFPAAELGASWIRAMHGPFPEANFVCTGGVTIGNTEAFLAAGAAGVSLGSALSDPDQVSMLGDLIGRIAR